MFEITKDEEFVSVTVKLKKRTHCRDKKIVIRTRDALQAARKKFSELDISEITEKAFTVSNTSSVNEATWKFKIKQPLKIEQETSRFSRRQRRAPEQQVQLVNKEDNVLSGSEKANSDLTEEKTCDKVDEAEKKAE